MRESVSELEKMITTKTIVGEEIRVDERVIIPVTKVCFGFGVGGGEKEGECSGGGGGGGATVEPIAFIVVSPDKVELLSIGGKSKVEQAVELASDVLDNILKIKKAKKEEENKKEE